jgi:hypothetical protein
MIDNTDANSMFVLFSGQAQTGYKESAAERMVWTRSEVKAVL